MAVEADFGAGDGGDSWRGMEDELGRSGGGSGKRFVNHAVCPLSARFDLVLGVQVAPTFDAGGE